MNQSPQPPQPMPPQRAMPGPFANQQAVNAGNVTGRLRAEGAYNPNAGSASGNRGAMDLQKSRAMESEAQGIRGIEGTNAQQSNQAQMAKSAAMQQALSNQARIYSDASGRAVDQIGLATQIQNAMMQSRDAFRHALLS